MKLRLENSRRQSVWVVVIFVISTVTAMAVMWRAPTLNFTARDALMRGRGTFEPPAEVVIVAIDEASVKRFGRFPWPRSLTARALDKISAAHPKVIALNVLYSDPTNETDDAALTEAIRRAGNVVIAAQLVETPLGGAEWLRPLPAIEQAAAGVGHGNVVTDFDSVARSLTLQQANDDGDALWALTVEVMRVGDGLRADEVRETPDAVKIGSRLIPIEADRGNVTIMAGEQRNSPETLRAGRMMIDYLGPAGSFADHTLSMTEVIDGRVDPEKLRGRYVLIGVTAAAMSDRVASPFAGFAAGKGDQRGGLMAGVEVSANALTTVLRSRYYTETPDWMAALIAALIALAVISALSLAQGNDDLPRQILTLLGMGGLILILSELAFTRWMVTPPLVPAIVSLVTSAPLALLLRSLTVSATLDERISQMTRESARLSPLALDLEPLAGKLPWWPRGTARKARSLAILQNRLLARTQFIDRALQSVEDGLVIADVNGRIAFSNPCAAKILQLPELSLIGSNLFNRLSEAEDGAELLPDQLARDQLERTKREALSKLLIDRTAIEREIVIGAAEPRSYTLRLSAVTDGKTSALLGIVAAFSDITKQRELQQLQNDVMTLVTHEMKTPLTAIKGMSEVLMKFDPDAGKRREMHTTINEAAQRLTRMIDDYLDLTSLELGARQLRLAFHRVESLIEQTLLLLEPIAAQRAIEFVRRLAPESPPVLVDADLFARALTNLIANAIKYSPPGTKVVISAQAGDEAIFIAVADQGPGIPPEHRAQIFEKFFRVPRVEDADTPGAGLGLTLVREVMELHGGRVTVESEVGSGSTFTLRLPLKRRADKAGES